MGQNIWIFNQFASTPETNTGAGERFYYLSNYFAKVGFETTIFSASYNHLFLKQPVRKFPYKVDEYKGFRFVWVWVTKYNPSSGLQRLLNWLSFVFSLFIIRKKRWGKPDVIIVSSMSIWPILNALWYKLFSGRVKIIFEVRDVWPLTPILIGRMSKFNPVIRIMFWLEKLSYSKSDFLVSVLPKANIRFQEVLGHDNFNFSWIPNAIEHDVANWEEKKEPEKVQEFHIMYAGAIGPANQIDVLIEAAKRLKDIDVKFTIMGDGPERAKLEKDTLGLKVSFTGKIPKYEVHQILVDADALFIAWRDIDLYKYGVSANKYNDYMKLAKPILSVSNLPDDPVKQSNCGLVVQPNSSTSLDRAIMKLKAMDENDRKKLGKNGYNYFIKYQTYEVISRKYIDVIKSLWNE